jgi:predicted acyltransferase
MNARSIPSSIPSARLASLDILRGFDLFMLVFFQPVFVAFARHWSETPVFSFLLKQFNHIPWVGFSAWDLVMPLFLFMVGTAMPFSFEKYLANPDKWAIYRKITKRFVILFILGAVVQGNLLSLDPLRLRLYSNTLQAIAVGYLISAILLLHLSRKGQFVVTFLLLAGYWALLTFLGDFTPDGNFAEAVDRAILGRFRDGVSYAEDGSWSFSDSYRYTWVLTSMVFGVTTMMGVFAGQIMKYGKDKKKNCQLLFVIGVVLLLSAWLLSFQTPIIKRIWSASMTLWSGGLCYLLMALFYYVVDYKGCSKGLNWLKIYGMNSIVAYTLGMVVNFRSVAHSLLWGLEQYTGDYYAAILTFANFLILFFILRLMFKQQIFVKI